ncbi:MAG: 30S ribosomal protein S8, partial [Oxalobacteraceae bacterium]
SPKDHALLVNIRYDSKREPVITNLRRVSTPGSRVYLGCDSLPRVKNGLGVTILTTSHGLMTDGQARKARVGGEPLCMVW